MTSQEIYDSSDKSWMQPVVYTERLRKASVYAEALEAYGDHVDLLGYEPSKEEERRWIRRYVGKWY